MEEKKKMFGFVVEGFDESDPAVYVGENREKVFKRAEMIASKISGKLFEVEKIVVNENDVSGICYYTRKDEKPETVFHDGRDPEDGYMFADWIKVA